jgi:hypothetical protein
MQGIASRGQANHETNADKDAGGEGEGGPHVCHDSNGGKQEPNKGEDYTDTVAPQQHIVCVL